MSKSLIASLFILLTASLAFVQDKFVPLEYGIYHDFIISIIQDFDLNIANQRIMRLNELEIPKVILTPQYYDSDYHPYGMAILYLPFAFLSRLFETELLLSLGTLFLTMLSLFLLVDYFKSKYNSLILITGLVTLYLGTPLFFYSIFIPGNANVAGYFFSTLLFLHLKKEQFKTPTFYTIWGVLYSFLLLTRHDAIFYFPLLLLPVIKKERIGWIHLGSFILGFFPVVFFYLINNYKQFGQIFISQGGIDFNSFLVWDLLFSPVHGYLFTSPLFLLPFFYLIISFKNIPKEHLLVLGIVLLKIVSESFTNNSGENFGARAYLIDLPFLMPIFLETIKRTKFVASVFAIASTVWCVSLIPHYLSGFRFMDYGNFFTDYYSMTSHYLEMLAFMKFEFYFVVIIISFCLFFYLIRKNFYHLQQAFILAFLLAFGVLTVSNVQKTFALNDFPQNQVIVGKGLEIWHLHESLGNFRERNRFYLYRNQEEQAKDVRRERNQYIERAKKQILHGTLDLPEGRDEF